MRDFFDFSDPETQLAVIALMWLQKLMIMPWVWIGGGAR